MSMEHPEDISEDDDDYEYENCAICGFRDCQLDEDQHQIDED